MNWILKAAVQNAVALLPSSLSYRLYYFLQRHIGDLKCIDPTVQLRAGIAIADHIRQTDHAIAQKTFIEVGTGRRLNLPIALWLCGAAHITTVDLNPYLKFELVQADLAYIRSHQQKIKDLFGDYAEQSLFSQRFDQLIGWTGTNVWELLSILDVHYLAPADAAHLKLPSQSIDYHVSYTVLEHVPPRDLCRLLIEGNRLLKKDGLFVHHIDFTDHFYYSDHYISSVNFLQFSEHEWNRWAGNRYMYHNRLRVDEFLDLVHTSGLSILTLDQQIDSAAQQLIEEEAIGLNERFRGKPADVNATLNAWVVAAPG